MKNVFIRLCSRGQTALFTTVHSRWHYTWAHHAKNDIDIEPTTIWMKSWRQLKKYVWIERTQPVRCMNHEEQKREIVDRKRLRTFKHSTLLYATAFFQAEFDYRRSMLCSPSYLRPNPNTLCLNLGFQIENKHEWNRERNREQISKCKW